MDTLMIRREKENTPLEPHRLTKRIGSTVYEVNVHFSQDARETMDDKIMRIIRNDIQNGKAAG